MYISLIDPLPKDFVTPEGFKAVGLVDDAVLAYSIGRTPYRITSTGREQLDLDQVNPALAEAVDEAGILIWPGGWTHALPLAFELNRRSCQPDRIAKNGLPPDILEAIHKLGSHPQARQMGLAASLIARVEDMCKENGNGDMIEIMSSSFKIVTGVRKLSRDRKELLNQRLASEITEEEPIKPSM